MKRKYMSNLHGRLKWGVEMKNIVNHSNEMNHSNTNKILKEDVVITPEFIYLLSYSLWLTASFIENLSLLSQFLNHNVFALIRLVALLLLCIKEFWTLKIDIRTILGYLFLFLGLIIWVKSGVSSIFDIIFFIIAFKQCDFSKILKIQLVIMSVLTLLTIVSAYVGLIDNRIYYQLGRFRLSFGFAYSTFLPQVFLFMCLMYTQLRKSKMRLIEIIGLLAINLILFLLTNTRNPFILVNVYLIFIFLYNFSAIIRKVAGKIAIILIPIFVFSGFVSYFFSKTYDASKFYTFLNTMLSGRLILGNSALLNYRIEPFGQKVSLIGKATIEYGNVSVFDTYNYIDSSYLQILVSYGYVFFIVILILLSIALYKEYVNKDMFLFFALVIVAIHSIIDPQLIMLWYSPFILLTGKFFIKKGRKN